MEIVFQKKDKYQSEMLSVFLVTTCTSSLSPFCVQQRAKTPLRTANRELINLFPIVDFCLMRSSGGEGDADCGPSQTD